MFPTSQTGEDHALKGMYSQLLQHTVQQEISVFRLHIFDSIKVVLIVLTSMLNPAHSFNPGHV